MATKAFLVGINDYTPCGPGGNDLRGCVNDVRDMANTLVILGFDPKKIKILTNCTATKDNIISGLNSLISGTSKGDTIVFYYSGHGSYVPDIHGDDIDKFDEILCPHDINFAKKIYILDDELRAIFSNIPAGVNLEVIADSCHSGTVTRGEVSDNAGTERFMEPPLDMSFYVDYIPDLPARKLLSNDNDKDMVIVPGLNHVLWAGCSDKQTSKELNISGVIRGLFTYNFCQILRKSNGNMIRKDVDKLLTAALAKYSQTPQLEASSPEMLQKPFK
jgi:metacaspase-1